MEFARDRGEKFRRRNSKLQYSNTPILQHSRPHCLLFTADNEPANQQNLYRGRSCFLICGGPSFEKLDHSKLRQPGVLTMGVNNSPKTFRPNLWTCGDEPDHFIRSIWLDPTILKLAPLEFRNAHVFDSDEWKYLDKTVADCPNVWFYKRHMGFDPARFLTADTCCWGNEDRHGGGRSVMLPTLRLLHYLGIRRIFLLGCDFWMSSKRAYHFNQRSAADSTRRNNNSYNVLRERFKQLQPIFEASGLHIYNCNPESKLDVFEKIGFDRAIAMSLEEWGNINVATERTAGLYNLQKPQPIRPKPTLPASFKSGLAVITCTRNRHETFKLLERWMRRQTRKWDQWIVVNDGQQRYEYTLGQEVIERVPMNGEGHSLAANLLAALPKVHHEHIAFVEDDDWIGPKFLESLDDALKKAPLVGSVPARYYNVATSRWQDVRNYTHASLGQTAIHAKLLPFLAEIAGYGSPWIDTMLWRKWRGKRKFIRSEGLHVGIKGMPGENGIGIGHSVDFGRLDAKPCFGTLRGWIGEDSNVYFQLKPRASALATTLQIGCVITCHNYGRYLRECVESCLAQTMPLAAIVIVDDASGDDTSVVAKRVVEHSSRSGQPITAYVRVNHHNAGRARNAGYSKLLSLVSGITHVIFVDADNTLVPNSVKLLLPKLADLRVGVAYGNLLCFGDRAGLSTAIKPWTPGALQQRNMVDACALIRREALDQLGGWDIQVNRMEDWLTWSKMEANGWRFAFVPEVTCRYRVHRGQKSERVDLDFTAVRLAWRIAVVTPFCGREWSLSRYESILQSQDWPNDNLYVVAVDNSNSKVFGAELRTMLNRVGVPHVVVPCPATIDGTPGAHFADDANKRTVQCYKFNLHVGRLWVTGRQFLPAWATHVWTLEDDIEPPKSALNQLALALWENWSASVASGFARNRFSKRWMMFRGNQCISPAGCVTEADRSGFYCALWRRAAFDSVVLAPSYARTPHGRGYYDWIAYDSLRAAGGKLLAAGNVTCTHWLANGAAL
jgi:glycosyltransferase involved in cell wall biosynthesis